MDKKSTTEEFITKSITKHGYKYDYSLVDYKNNITKVKIICKIHGIFEQSPNSHLSMRGCPSCSGNIKLTIENFIVKSILKHGYKYDYSLVDYKNNRTKVKIVCKEHGIFEQIPLNHLKGVGCPYCVGLATPTNEEFIKKCIRIHGDKYDYSLIRYETAKTKVKIICREHGIFKQTPNDHLSAYGCPSCSKGGFSSNKSGIFYYIRFDNKFLEPLYKIGITNINVKNRLNSMHVSNCWFPTIISQEYFKNGIDALNKESLIKFIYRDFQYKGEHILGNGNTELYIKDILELEYK